MNNKTTIQAIVEAKQALNNFFYEILEALNLNRFFKLKKTEHEFCFCGSPIEFYTPVSDTCDHNGEHVQTEHDGANYCTNKNCYHYFVPIE